MSVARAWRTWWDTRRGRLARLWAVGLVSSLLVTGASSLGYLESLQTGALDLMLWLRGQRLASAVVLVAVDDTAFDGLGRRQPLSPAYLARVLRGIERCGATVVGLDVRLTPPSGSEEDGALGDAIRRFSDAGLSRVVLVEGAPFLDGVLQGSSAMPVDADGVVRYFAPFVPRKDGPTAPALNVAVLARLAGLDGAALERAVSAGDVRLPGPLPERRDSIAAAPLVLRAGDRLRINFAGPAGSFLTIPSDAVAALAEPGVAVAWDNPLRGRTVLVGATFGDARDSYPTPHGWMSGVEIHANALHMLMTGTFIQPAGWSSLGLQLVVVWLGAAVFLALPPLAGFFASVAGALAASAAASVVAFRAGGYWVDFVLPVLATCGLGLGVHLAEGWRVRAAFGRYVSPEVVARIRADAPSLRGERREISVLFSDLRDFTTLSEGMPAEKVAAHLNEYFPAMTAAIFAERGMINDFIGDAVMAVFGAPLDDPDHALHAVRSAAAMERALRALNRQWTQAGRPALRMGIGIHSGEAFAGNVGGPRRVKYTVVGDPVNVGSRVEGLNKELGTTVLITDATYRKLGQRVDVKDRGEMAVKGRAHPVRVWELLAVEGRRVDAEGGE
jgi:adenylate cyclase